MKHIKTVFIKPSYKYDNILKNFVFANATIFLSAAFALSASAETIDTRQQITENTTYTDLTASGIYSTVSNNGGVFYLEDVQDVTLTFNGSTLFENNKIMNGGMGGAIGNGWLATKDSEKWSPYTPGGKIVFNGPTVFNSNTTNNSNGGGAIFNYGVGTLDSPDIIFNNTATFDGNTATASSDSVYVGGGALNHTGGMIIFNGETSFTDNESASKGGAVMSAGDIIFKEKTTFQNNNATIQGGALAIIGGNVSFEKEASFSDNTAGNGAAISMSEENSSLSFKDAVSFQNNTGTATLWNNNATGNIAFENGALFEGNTNTLNGTLQNAGSVSLSGGNLSFINNTGSNGGGLKNAGNVNITTTGDVLFDNNTTTSSAGAFDNGGTVIMSANKITFNKNTADSGYGGAVFNAADISLLGKENVFTSNVASDTKTIKSGGGAIHNRGNTGTASLIIGSADSINTFDGNISKAHGGAVVSRAVDGEGQDSEVTINGTTTFSNNNATANGGAIWNYVAEKSGTTGKATIVFNGDTTFSSNTAGGLGGAVYNNGTMTFNGTSLFVANTDSSGRNDIYNDGTINFSGDVTLDGGIAGAGAVSFGPDVSLSAELNKTSILANTVTFEGNNTLKLIVANGLSDAEYSFISADTLNGEENITLADNPIYNLDMTDSGKISVHTKSADEIAQSIDLPVSSQDVNALAAVVATNGNSTDVGNQITTAISEAMQTGNVEEAIKATKDLAPTTSQQIISVSESVNKLLSNAVGSRMASIGRAGGDAFIGGSTWAQVLYNHAKQSRGNKTDGFRANSSGVALGVDGKVNKDFLIGIGYGYTDTRAKTGGHKIDIDGNNIFAYAEYQPNRWYINGMLNYGFAKYHEKKAPAGIFMKAKYDVNSYAADLMTGYDLNSGFTPEAGLRYLLVEQKAYNDGAQRIKADNSDVLTGVAGIKYGADIKAEEWIIKPALRLAATYDMISDNSKANVSVIGGGNYQITGKRLHRFGVETGLSVVAGYENWDFSIDYNSGFRKDFQSYTGMLKAKYNF